MLSSLPIGRGRVVGPTSLYTRTPLPRVRQDARPLVISTSRSPSLVSPVFPVFPSRRWITHEPTLPNWSQLPRPSSAHAPKPPDLERRRKHLRTMKDPVTRTDSPYTDPSVKGPRSQILSHQNPPQTVNSTSSAAVSSPGLVAVANRRPRRCSDSQHRQQDRPPSRWHCVSACRSKQDTNTRTGTDQKQSSPHREHTELGMR